MRPNLFAICSLCIKFVCVVSQFLFLFSAKNGDPKEFISVELFSVVSRNTAVILLVKFVLYMGKVIFQMNVFENGLRILIMGTLT